MPTKKNTGSCVVNNSGSTLESWWKRRRVSSRGITSEHKPEEPALEPECGTPPQDSKDAPGWRARQRPGAALYTPPQSFQAVPRFAFSLLSLPAGISPASPVGPHRSHSSARNLLPSSPWERLISFLVSWSQSNRFSFEPVLRVSRSTPIVLSKYFFQGDGMVSL